MTQSTSSGISINAPAKINLSLDVLNRRTDGYHTLCMVMLQLALCDQVTVYLSEEAGIRVTTDAAYLPVGEGNSAWQAAMHLSRLCGIDMKHAGVEIHIRKRIPVAAGLAGGSTDAAAVLKALNQLWRLGMSSEELQQVGLAIGADVPYCVMGGTALAEGIGERLTPLKTARPIWVVLVKPSVSVSTGQVYQKLELDQIRHQRPDTLALIAALAEGDIRRIGEVTANVLESVTVSMVPEVAVIKKKLLGFNAAVSLMSGSGPTVFGLFRDKEKAESAGAKLSLLYRDVFVTYTIDADGL